MRLYYPLTVLIKQLMYPFISIAIPILTYIIVLVIDIPQEIGLAARYGFTSVPVPFALLFYLTCRYSGWQGRLASLSLTLVLFALPLSGLWDSGSSATSIVTGLFPLFDASNYYTDALRLLEGANFSDFPSRRPLWKQFLLDDYAFFSFINNDKLSNLKLSISLQILTIIGLYSFYRQRKNADGPLLIAIAIGVLISVPLLPPWDADAMRVYAATIPILAILPALGLAFILRKSDNNHLIDEHQPINTERQDEQPTFQIGFGIILALFIFLAPLITKVFSHAPQFANVTCLDGTISAYVRINHGASINLIEDKSTGKTHLPNVRLSDFRNGVASASGLPSEAIKELSLLDSSTTIKDTLNLRNLQHIWVIAPSRMIQNESGIISFCGKLSKIPDIQGLFPTIQPFGIFYVSSVPSIATIDSKYY